MPDKKDGATAVAEKIASWPTNYAAVGARLHEIVLEVAPTVAPKMFYGAAGYARTTSGPVLFFFRYDPEVMSIGRTEKGDISVPEGADDQLVPSAWFLQPTSPELDAATEKHLTEIVREVLA